MRSPERRYTTLWLSCLLVGIIGGSAWAGVSGEIAGVRFDPANKQITIDSKGKVGKHFARVMARPNRLVMDFENTSVGKVPATIGIGAADIKEIRLGKTKSRARLVVDFQDRPVPPFHVRRADNQMLVVFGAAASAADLAVEEEHGPQGIQNSASALDPKAVPAVAPTQGQAPAQRVVQAPTNPQLPLARVSAGSPAKGTAAGEQTAKKMNGWTVGTWGGPASTPAAQGAHVRGVTMAQNMEMNGPPAALPNRGRGGAAPAPPAARQSIPATVSQGNSGPGPGLPREVRPPVTPPTPDPRLLVQEITELKFIQVGHNSRLIIRGGDHLDYRLAKDSPTKLRIDLINAEIPKLHQKPLRTDLFSTSVEMIVPGSQTIFVQLKDAVTYQVEKEKGVLMIDFPPPRFVLSADQKKSGGLTRPQPGADLGARDTAQQAQALRREEMQLFRQQEIEKQNEVRRHYIEMLQKQQEEFEKQRTELLRRYRVTPEPEAFSKKVSMDFQGISLKNAFRLLAEQAGMNIIVDEKVTGSTTLRLFQVPLGQVIDTILNSNGLDREMVGNVMRVGPKKDIADLKKERAEEYQKRMDELSKRIADVGNQIRDKDKEIKTANEELKKFTDLKQEETPVPPEEVRTEEIGEAGCDKILGKDVCFFYARIKLVYADPDQIRKTLDCMFNMKCGQVAGGVASPSTPPTLEQRATQVDERGFIGEAREERMRTERAELRRQETLNVQKEFAATAEQQLRGQRQALAAGETPFLAELIKHTILWADKDYNSLFIRDTQDRLQQMKKVILSLDIPVPQVSIESRIVQVARGWGRGLGIVWGGRNNQVGPYTDARTGYWGVAGIAPGAATPTGAATLGNNIPSQFAVNLPATIAGGTPLGLATQFGMLAATGAGALTELDLRLTLGEASNLVNTISRPKVQVLNKKKASIKLGKQIPYLTTSALGTQTQLINADLLLDVTPEIFADGRILMQIKVTNNTPDSPGANPTITTREAQTIMTVKDGQTAVIGGILTSSDTSSRQGWPGLMNVPVINLLFSNKSKDTSLNELMVFLTPTIVKRPPSAS
ncbi:MAG: AMIN domain-containing protein [Desulfomonile tiedjei]|nr:AMIN domain-containing protein [Desulfomonile tiedjei]